MCDIWMGFEFLLAAVLRETRTSRGRQDSAERAFGSDRPRQLRQPTAPPQCSLRQPVTITPPVVTAPRRMDPDFYPAPATLPLLLQHAVWVALAPVAWFLAAALSRARYLALAELGWPRVRGRRGRRERRERIRLGLPVPPRPCPEERALGPLRANGDNEDDGDHATSDGVPVSAAPSEVKIALGAVLCALFLIVDILLVWNVSDGWLDAAFCTFFGALTMVRALLLMAARPVSTGARPKHLLNRVVLFAGFLPRRGCLLEGARSANDIRSAKRWL